MIETLADVKTVKLTYQVEPFDTAFEEAQELLLAHWEEIALDKDKIKLDVDAERYRELDRKGMLHIVTVRDANDQKWAYDPGKLVGYHVSILCNHLHYKNDFHAMTDIFFLKKEHRVGRAGIDMFLFVEDSLRKRGVVKIMTSVKLHLDVGRIFEWLGYKPIERVYSKYIGDK
jgi:hypothetical protein